MVGIFYLPVYPTIIGLQVIGTKNVVYAHEKAIAVIADAWPIGTGHVAIGKPLRHSTQGIGLRAIVEVATHYHRLPLMRLDIIRHCPGLRGSLGSSLRQFINQELGCLLYHLLVSQFPFHQALELASVLRRKSRGLKMIVDDEEGIRWQFEVESRAQVSP